MPVFVKALSFIAVAAVVTVLVMGLWNMMKGGSPNRSQALMRMRVLLQFVALVVLMVLLWVSSKG
jgi:quinol-cytochrome oxidoreductase complex cytochrome b subunit